MEYTLQDITPVTREEKIEYLEYIKDLSERRWESEIVSSRRVSLLYKRQANDFKDLATDDVVDEKADANYEQQALENWQAYTILN